MLRRHVGCAGPKVIKLFSCSARLSMKFFPLIYVEMPIIVGILPCMSGKNNILCLTGPGAGGGEVLGVFILISI